MSPVRLTVTARRDQSWALASPLFLTYAFAGLVTVGTIGLLMPFAHRGGGFTPFLDALFTATSAATLTGLVTQETATYWTRTGQVFILALMFVGGLGFMTIATFFMLLVGQRVTLAQRLLVADSLQINQLGGLARLTIRIVIVASVIQFAGFVGLLVRFSFVYPPAEAVWQAVFQAVSAFNSAGFAVVPEGSSLSALQNDGAVLGIMGGLIVLGAISYSVMVDVVKFRRFSLYTLNSKLVIILTLTLVISGALVFFLSEYDNPNTLGPLRLGQKAMVSVFESISGRSAGFSTVDYGMTEQPTNFFFTSMMFIGGASASVAGGIKVNTVAVVLVGVISVIGGRSHASAFGREIPQAQVQRAVGIFAVFAAVIFLVALMLSFAENGFAFMDLLFEIVSAFGAVGLSTGLTSELSSWGQVIIIATMFVGRIGPFTLALVMAHSSEADLYRYAQERVTIG